MFGSIIANAPVAPKLALLASRFGSQAAVERVAQSLVGGQPDDSLPMEKARLGADRFIELVFLPYQMRALLGEFRLPSATACTSLTHPLQGDRISSKRGAPILENTEHPHTHQSHADIVKRLKRAEGHLRSITTMIEAARPCVEIAQQLHAVEKAICQAKRTLIQDHIDHCLEDTLSESNKSSRNALQEFKQITKYL